MAIASPFPPGVEFRPKRMNRSCFGMKVSMNGHRLKGFPSLNGAHVPVEVACNFLPGVESVRIFRREVPLPAPRFERSGSCRDLRVHGCNRFLFIHASRCGCASRGLSSAWYTLRSKVLSINQECGDCWMRENDRTSEQIATACSGQMRLRGRTALIDRRVRESTNMHVPSLCPNSCTGHMASGKANVFPQADRLI